MNDMSTYDLPENSRPAEVWGTGALRTKQCEYDVQGSGNKREIHDLRV